MALIPCRDCREQVSSHADYCRHCGRFMLWGKLDEMLYLLFVVLVAGFFAAIILVIQDLS